MLCEIILAMGADQVDVIPHLTRAFKLDGYHMVVLKDDALHCRRLTNVPTVNWAWVKDLLISGRQIPLPTWHEGPNGHYSTRN